MRRAQKDYEDKSMAPKEPPRAPEPKPVPSGPAVGGRPSERELAEQAREAQPRPSERELAEEAAERAREQQEAAEERIEESRP